MNPLRTRCLIRGPLSTFFLQIRYAQYIPAGEVAKARMIVDPMALTGTTGDNEGPAAAKADGE
eukprot:4051875-Pyramimonas_sp.AAC.1